MSLGTLSCADQFSWLIRRRPLSWVDLYRRPEATSALVNMRSLNSLVTDSAAASSSWGSGSRVRNGALNLLPDGRILKTLYALFGEAGWARGLVTTTEITHATPAGFAANAEDRGTAPLIALQYLQAQVEVLLGGGQQYFDPAERKDQRDVKADYRRAGYEVLENRVQLAAASLRQPWLGLFARGHLPFTLDHQSHPELRAQVPTLAEMTRAALRRLQSARHFILQVEGGRVDHAAHSSDAAAAMWDQLAFDEALDACLEFQRQVPETLLVITTDHGNSNLGLNGMGTSYGQSPGLFARLARVKKSFAELAKDFQRVGGVTMSTKDGTSSRLVLSTSQLTELLEAGIGCTITPPQASLFTRYLAGEHPPLYEQMNGLSAQLGQLLANHLGIGWTGNSHTADYVPLLAVGPGAERFRGFLQNTDVFHHYLALARIRFRNPEVPLLAECGPTAREAERPAVA
jgi:alkaline phosphatase